MLLECLIVLLQFVAFSQQNNWSSMCSISVLAGKSCYGSKVYDDIPSIDERLAPIANDSIFFIDTSCDGELTIRKACSIESAARTNPDREVIILFVGPVTTRSLITSSCWEILKYRNVNLYRINLETYFKGTPLPVTEKRRCIHQRLSDVLRFVTLFKYGGIYLDMHVVVLKSFSLLRENKNFAGQINVYTMGSAVLGLSNRGVGRKISQKILSFYDFSIKNRGPLEKPNDILTQIVKAYCNASSVDEISTSGCKDFVLYETRFFYPMSVANWKTYSATFDGEVPVGLFGFYIWDYDQRVMVEEQINAENYLNSRLMSIVCPRTANITLSYGKSPLDAQSL